jgi:hypothetical protein
VVHPLATCTQAAVMIHRMFQKTGVILRCHVSSAAVVIHRMLLCGSRCYPRPVRLPDPQNASRQACAPRHHRSSLLLVIQNAIGRRGVHCCHASSLPLWISQNAPVQGRVCYNLRCHACSRCCDPQNAQVEGCATPALPCMLAGCQIHRTPAWKKVIPALPFAAAVVITQNALVEGRVLRCHASTLPPGFTECSGARRWHPAQPCMQAAVMIHRMLEAAGAACAAM